MMPPYPIHCTTRDCERLAVYKVAARWSDGFTQELKTYALSCANCVSDWFFKSMAKRNTCRLTPGEVLDEPGIWEMAQGTRDVGLRRMTELEQELLARTTP